MFSSIVVFLTYLSTISLTIFLVLYVYFKYKNRYRDKCLASIPGPEPRYPLIGNIDLFRIPGVPLNECVYKTLVSLCRLYKNYGIYKISLGPQPVVVVFKHNLMDAIFSSNVHIEKSEQYKFLSDWLGDGLLLSTGAKWKGRRKLLTPAFHFKILDDFIPLMNAQTNIFLDKIKDMSTDRQYIDIREPIAQLTLDIICETAMGVQVGAQVGKNKPYVAAIHDLGEILMKRVFSPWIWPDVVFNRTPIGRTFCRSLNTLHSFTRNVINQKKQQFISNNDTKTTDQLTSDDNIYYSTNKKKKSMAFLDLLLEYHIKDNKLSLEDIREEVDTFMFEGHDTTSVSLGWSLYLLGLHREVQDKIHDELTAIFGDDIDNNQRDITAEDIQRMTYLECVLKESLRMYPSVPFIGRHLAEDCPVGDYVIPAGVDVFMIVEQMHYDSDVFPDPNHFRPERFQSDTTSSSSSSTTINAYNYVPFSAGPRGCIGKRFAVTEEKIILAKVCQNFYIESIEPLDSIQISAEMVFRAKSPLNVRFIPKTY
ncbi:cytochrome P450 4C1-like [Oppia nitens]|uniref:cytochrome P450 4C1-like n=1 Tax=Oppia nitens TaxID=1686743 RepID=UPI0023DAEB01|nr:cytochrome P450 4C1-like [Oppia nitens]